jgi:D-cysteine desulfhydrase
LSESVARVALFRWLPRLAARVPWVVLGDWPTPLDPIAVDGRPIWIKREGDSSARYGGNKIRTLEAWLGHARAAGAKRIWAMGAYGSNHAIATIVHARAIGMDAGAVVFPQPASEWAIENAGAMIDSRCELVRLRSVIEAPFAGIALAAGARWSDTFLLRLVAAAEVAIGGIVMPPGGATPVGTFGALSAAFELAEQIAAGAAPPPRRIVLPVGSTCTTAGLLAGLHVAHALGAWRWPLPIVHGVRVTPWPVTSHALTVALAARTLARLEALGGPRVAASSRELASRLVIDGREIGAGYGRITPRASAAMQTITGAGAPRLDGVYSGKAAAALLRLHARGIGPLVFWATKSTVRMNAPSVDALRTAPRALVRWITS